MKYTEKGTLILDGKLVAQEIQNTIKKTIDDSNVKITLATVLVGEDKPSKLYVNNKHKQATLSSIKSVHINLPEDISQDALENKISELGKEPSINGILIQMPLPKGLNEDSVIEMIPIEKDVDGLKEQNLGKIIVGSSGPYEYLVSSIDQFYDQYELLELMEDNKFASVQFRNLSNGISAIHSGWKI